MIKYILCPAADGGFIIQKIVPMTGFQEGFALAGSLSECLDYLRRQFPEPAAAPVPAPVLAPPVSAVPKAIYTGPPARPDEPYISGKLL